MLKWITLAVALFFAINIGGSGSAAAMASAYGGRVINKRLALVLMAVFAWLGAVVGGSAVIKTISSGIVPAELFKLDVAFIVLVSSSLTLFFANMLKIPLSTSQVTVGAVIAIGIYKGVLNSTMVGIIVAGWIIIPAASYVIAYFLGKHVDPPFMRWLTSFRSEDKIRKVLGWVVIGSGCMVAFAVGANNAANAVGPLVGAGVMSVGTGAMLGGIFIAIGALALGGRTLHTTGREITELCVVKSSFVSLTTGGLIIAASFVGIPSPLAQSTTLAIVGMGSAKCGKEETLDGNVLSRIFKIWVISPVLAFVMSISLIHAKFSIFQQHGLTLSSLMFFVLSVIIIGLLITMKKRIGLSK